MIIFDLFGKLPAEINDAGFSLFSYQIDPAGPANPNAWCVCDRGKRRDERLRVDGYIFDRAHLGMHAPVDPPPSEAGPALQAAVINHAFLGNTISPPS